MVSVDIFIKGDNLNQALKCTEKILGRSVVKTLDQGAKAEEPKNEPRPRTSNESRTSQIISRESNELSPNKAKSNETSEATSNKATTSQIKNELEIKVRILDE